MSAILFDGVVQGLQLSLLAVGITLIYGLGGVLNLAHGQFAIAGGVLASLRMSKGIPPGISCLGGIAGAGLLGIVIDRTLLLPAYRFRGEERLLLGLILTLGLSFVIDGYLKHLGTERRLSPHTASNYARDLHALADYMDRGLLPDWSKVDSQHVRLFAARAHAGGLSPRSVQRRL